MLAFREVPLKGFRAASNVARRSTRYTYPCMGPTHIEGFAKFLEKELSQSRNNLTAFTEELCQTFGWSRLALTNSGSSANLAAALTIAEFCPKDPKTGSRGEFLTAGFTFPSTMASLLVAGFTLRVIDTEPGGFCLSPEAVARAIGPNTRGVCATHFLGFPAQMDKIVDVARGAKRPLFVLQDACETMNVSVKGKPAHEYGDITTWSFYHPHHLSSFGGGALSSSRPEWETVTQSITHWGRQCTCHFDKSRCRAPSGMHHNFWYVREGHNLEMSELNACFGRFQLRRWKEMEAKRFQFYEILQSRLKPLGSITLTPLVKDCGSPFVFPIVLNKAANGKGKTLAEIAKKMEEKSVEIRSLMGGAITEQPAYKHVPTDGLKNCRDIGSRSFFVGIHQTLHADAVHKVADILYEELK